MVLEKPTGTSIPELATEYQVSESTLYSLASQGKLPGCRRLGKRFVVHRATFEEWLRTGNGDEQEAAQQLHAAHQLGAE